MRTRLGQEPLAEGASSTMTYTSTEEGFPQQLHLALRSFNHPRRRQYHHRHRHFHQPRHSKGGLTSETGEATESIIEPVRQATTDATIEQTRS